MIRPLNRLAALAFLASLVCASGPSRGDPLPHLWSVRFGDANDQRTDSVVLDGNGNIIIFGSFFGSIDLGGGPLVSAGGRDLYLAKFTPAGVHLWSRRFGDANSQVAACVDVNSLGQAVITGAFQGSVSFGGATLVSAGGYDIYVAKFDAAGNHLWSHAYGDAQDQFGTSLGVGNGGMNYLAGHFSGVVDFGGGPLVSAGGTDIYLAEIDPSNGAHLWSERFGDAADQQRPDVACTPQGRLFLTGRTNGTVDFGGGPLTSAGSTDAFLAAFEAGGAHRWSRLLGGTGLDIGQAVDFQLTNDAVTILGQFSGAVDFGGGPLLSAGGLDIFLARYTTNGAHLWSRRFGGPVTEYPVDVAVRIWGEVAMTGYFEGSVDFGGGALTSGGQSDLFIATYDATGAHLSSQRAGDANRQEGEAIALGEDGRVVALGHFQGTIDLGGGPLTSLGAFDIYLATLGPISTGLEPAELGWSPAIRVLPNPTQRRFAVAFDLQDRADVRVELFDAAGRLIAVLADQTMDPGRHVAGWSPPPGRGGLASGIYHVRLSSGGAVRTAKLVVAE